MESEYLAEDMLAEVAFETLQEFLCDVRLDEAARRPGLALTTALDTCLSSVNDDGIPLKPGDVLEIQGPPASGKTHLVYQYIMMCTLPPQHQRVQFGGWGKAAIVFDTDGTFEISRLANLLRTKIADCMAVEESGGSAMLSPGESHFFINDLLSCCLRKLFVFRPTSSTQLAASLLNLRNYHTTSPEMQEEEIALLVVDSLSSFYWNDRFIMEQLRVGSLGHSTKSPFHHVVTALELVRHSYRPITLLTNWALNPLSKPSPSTGKSTSPFFKQHLHPFPTMSSLHPENEALPSVPSSEHDALVQPGSTVATTLGHPAPGDSRKLGLPLTYHVTLSPTLRQQFPSGSSPAEAEQMEIDQRTCIDSSKIEGLVRVLGNGKAGQFSFRVCENEVRNSS